MYYTFDIENRNDIFITTDRKYETTKPDRQGYSYWKETDKLYSMGSYSIDYVFVTENGKKYAAEKLNELIKRYE